MLQLKVIDGDKLKWATFFFTFHVFIFIPFIRKVVFYCITLCQVKSDRVCIIQCVRRDRQRDRDRERERDTERERERDLICLIK